MLTRIRNRLSLVVQFLVISASFYCVGIATPATADDAAARAVIEKANVYIELAKSTERAVESWERYRSWVNMKTGPTGKERYISYGMYDLSFNADQIAEVRKVAAAAPEIEKLDAAILRYIDAYAALEPVMNMASSYYERQAYLEDGMAEGKELHGKMMPLVTAFLSERDAMLTVLRAHVFEVEQVQLDATEKREGRTAAWHVGRVMHAANGVVNVFPRTRPQQMTSDEMDEAMRALGPDTPGEKFDQLIAGVVPPQNVVIDVGRYSAAVDAYASAVADFEKFSGKKPDNFDEFQPLPKQFLQIVRGFEKPLKASKGREFDGASQMFGRITQIYFAMLNAGSPLEQSQLRYLP